MGLVEERETRYRVDTLLARLMDNIPELARSADTPAPSQSHEAGAQSDLSARCSERRSALSTAALRLRLEAVHAAAEASATSHPLETSVIAFDGASCLLEPRLRIGTSLSSDVVANKRLWDTKPLRRRVANTTTM
jgi:hypothetical protein